MLKISFQRGLAALFVALACMHKCSGVSSIPTKIPTHLDYEHSKMAELVVDAGYPLEEHFVTTADGYVLGLYRIPRGNIQNSRSIRSNQNLGPPVLLQHGLLDCSDTWIINDEGKAPGFMLANKGYDVWFGNSRGNKHSRNHTKYNPDKGK